MNSGDEAFCSMYKHYLPLLKIIAAKKVPADDVEDIVQDVFVSYFTHYSPDKPESEVGPLLVKMTYNRCADYNRKRLNHPVSYYDPALMWEDAFMTDEVCDRDGLSVLLEKQEYKRVFDFLDVMKKDWSQIFRLYVLEERSVSEISKIVGISEGACRARLSRGRKFLRDYLETHKSLDIEKGQLKKVKKSKTSARIDLSDASEIPGST